MFDYILFNGSEPVRVVAERPKVDELSAHEVVSQAADLGDGDFTVWLAELERY